MMGHGNSGLMGAASAGQYAEMGILNNTYSEQAERDADHGGTILMQKAGFNPVGMLTFMERLGDFEDRSPQVNQGIFENHPPAEERIALLRGELAQMHVPVTARSLRLVSGGFRASVRAGTAAQTRMSSSTTTPSPPSPTRTARAPRPPPTCSTPCSTRACSFTRWTRTAAPSPPPPAPS